MSCPLIIKLGGILLENVCTLERFFKELYKFRQLNNRDIVIIHGSNSFSKIIYRNLNFFMNQKKYFSSDFLETLKIFSSTADHTFNTQLLGWFRQYALKGIGLSLSDSSIFHVEKLPKFYTLEDIFKFLKNKKFGSIDFLKILFKNNFIPLIYSYGISKNREIIKIDSDIVAMVLTILLKAELLILTDVSAVLNGKGHKISSISKQEADFLINKGIITDGMVTKIKTALYVSNFLKKSVEIASWHHEQDLEKLFNGVSIGTRIFSDII